LTVSIRILANFIPPFPPYLAGGREAMAMPQEGDQSFQEEQVLYEISMFMLSVVLLHATFVTPSSPLHHSGRFFVVSQG
jgi:hypothetical protein